MTLAEYLIVQLLLIFWAIYVIKNNPTKSNPSDKADYNYSQHVLVSSLISIIIFSVFLLRFYLDDISFVRPIWESIKGFFANLF